MKKLGFGCMRMPMKNNEVDTKIFSAMIDLCMAQGFHYFDTAHGYLDGKSESAVKQCLSQRYPRESFILTDKLTDSYFEKEADIRPLFEKQLKNCGVDYFDYYLMHALTAACYQKYVDCGAFRIGAELKAAGKIRHFGISFHDKAEVLERILREQPAIEVVQLQFNYIDYDDAIIQSKACLDICRKYQKPVIVMEPLKGGHLVNLPDTAQRIFEELGGSPAAYGLRYAASFDGVCLVLSGMSDIAQVKENLAVMTDFKPLSTAEFAAVEKVRTAYQALDRIPCTACRYCIDDCPEHIAIPELFACLNAKKQFNDWNSDWYYTIATQNNGKPSDCRQCGSCEKTCPQHLHICDLLKEVATEFEKEKPMKTLLEKKHTANEKTAKVYFTGDITPAGLNKVYQALGRKTKGNVGVKVSTGEPGGHNFLSGALIKPLVDEVKGTIIECNTAYPGRRMETAEHKKVFVEHGWTAIAPVDLMDEDGAEMSLPVKDGKHLKENIVGAHLANYDFIINLAHFKGHAMGGFGGVLKNQSIGIASSKGKSLIHTAGKETSGFGMDTPKDDFLESMAEAAKSVADYMGENIVYIDVMNKLSVDCDCDSHPADPEMDDIGILASLDPVALDQACVDLVYASKKGNNKPLIERMESRHGIHTVEHAEEIGLGTRNYLLISTD